MATATTELTKRQRDVFDYIRNALLRGEPCPSFRELCMAFGLKSTNGIVVHLNALERKGFIVISRGQARSITLAKRNGCCPCCGHKVEGRKDGR